MLRMYFEIEIGINGWGRIGHLGSAMYGTWGHYVVRVNL